LSACRAAGLSLNSTHHTNVLRAAGEIIGEKQFIIIGSQSLHGKYPDLADEIFMSAEVDLIAKNSPEKAESLNFIGVHSRFHETHGYYADPVDENTAAGAASWVAVKSTTNKRLGVSLIKFFPSLPSLPVDYGPRQSV
jgi:hypothetical protein